MSEPTRTRTVTWADPLQTAAAGRSLSGLQFMTALQRGELPLPPIAKLLGYGVSQVSEGRVTFEMVPGEHLYNPIGSIHGGVAATLLDTAMACAVHTKLPQGDWYTTIELHLNYVKAIGAKTPSLRAVGEVIHVGGRLATAQGRLEDETGTLYAHGTTTCMLFRQGR